MKNKDLHCYEDIIELPRPVSRKHPAMPLIDRAAQFAPFAALTGHKEAIQETERLTQPRILLDENQKELLDGILMSLQQRIKERPLIKITYYIPDANKAGGSYVTITKALKKIDEFERTLHFVDKTKVSIHDISAIEQIDQNAQSL